ncbi:IucA/IucC family protein [Kribbella qitaiheensis]|uniref:IucA/IucC family protein n=1 Tax=Kribbella qitaiheensis TaxID=1544730 RepID=A0A7G6X833_9ACTN|nr:IucA/IucC family protein [Kribbella qitaiheensis]QNE22398.1 IucA/IucC family protein [Kribbella qitaiheensis]
MSWAEKSSELLAKLISQLCTEDLLQPIDDRLELGEATYTFTSSRGAFGSYRVAPGSVRRTASGILGNDESEACIDPVQFLVDAAPVLGLPGSTVAGYVAELSSTLAADVRMASSAVSNASLLGLHHSSLEGHLTGHPLLVANKGRLGFSASDSALYAPEARTPLRLVWLAVRRGLAEFRGTPDLSEHAVIAQELGPCAEEFRDLLDDPDAYVWLPCHPWQLDHVVRTQWARELARGEIVVLGEGPAEYLPTQSIRTMVNVSDPCRYQVKLPLKILNTSVYRGLPEHCTLAAPMVTQWLRGLWQRDELLGRLGTELLGEVASVTVRHPQLSFAPGVPYQWTETLGCIWREPVEPRLQPGETVWPLAAVLHRDVAGEPLAAAMVARSGVDASTWIGELLSALMRPLLHLMHHYGITVNPHGENLAVICTPSGVPARIVIKDLVDDINVSTTPIPARGTEPDSHHRILPRKPWHILRQYLVDALLLGVLAPLDTILADSSLLPPGHLWSQLRGEIELYAATFPEYADRLSATALLGETFARYPLNGYRLTSGYADLATRPPVPVTGRMPNPLFSVDPIAPVRPW